MRIRTSSRLSGYMPGVVTDWPAYTMFGSLAGLGQDPMDPTIYTDPTLTSAPIEIPALPVSDLQLANLQELQSALSSTVPATLPNLFIPVTGGYVNAQTGQATTTLPPNSDVQEIAQIVNAATTAAQNALKIYQQSSGPSAPYLVPGTNLVYNPATGQLGSAFGITGQQIAPAALASILPVGLVIIGLFLVMSMMGGRR